MSIYFNQVILYKKYTNSLFVWYVTSKWVVKKVNTIAIQKRKKKNLYRKNSGEGLFWEVRLKRYRGFEMWKRRRLSSGQCWTLNPCFHKANFISDTLISFEFNVFRYLALAFFSIQHYKFLSQPDTGNLWLMCEYTRICILTYIASFLWNCL